MINANTIKIEQDIEAEWAKFQNSSWPNAVPPDLITVFKAALLESPPMKHQVHTKKLRAILKKEKPKEKLTYIEIGLIINIVLNSPLFILSDDIETALTKLEVIEGIRSQYNDTVKEKETQLISKKQTLLKLADPAGTGTGNGKLNLVN